MKVTPDCVPCYLKQVISTLRFAGVEDKEINIYLYKIVNLIPGLSLDASPAENSTIILKKLYELLNDPDPYKSYKIKWNNLIMRKYGFLKKLVERSDDKLLTALKISVAGNIIDMGIMPDFDLSKALREITRKEFELSDYHDLAKKLATPCLILILGDNCGEIVFDKVLSEELTGRGHEVVYAVKSKPMLNDATIEDAKQINLCSVCRVIENGSSYLGTEIKFCSEEFLTEFKKADIVISKGQANFESLEGSIIAGEKTFFLLRAKCEPVAHALKVSPGSIVLKKNRS